MLKTLTPLLGAALLAASTALYAQAPAPGAGDKGPQRKHQRFDCSKAKDPKACEERRTKVREARDKARKACEGKQGAERGACMQKEACAQASDPAKCEARIKERVEKRKERRDRQPAEKK